MKYCQKYRFVTTYLIKNDVIMFDVCNRYIFIKCKIKLKKIFNPVLNFNYKFFILQNYKKYIHTKSTFHSLHFAYEVINLKCFHFIRKRRFDSPLTMKPETSLKIWTI